LGPGWPGPPLLGRSLLPSGVTPLAALDDLVTERAALRHVLALLDEAQRG